MFRLVTHLVLKDFNKRQSLCWEVEVAAEALAKEKEAEEKTKVSSIEQIANAVD